MGGPDQTDRPVLWVGSGWGTGRAPVEFPPASSPREPSRRAKPGPPGAGRAAMTIAEARAPADREGSMPDLRPVLANAVTRAPGPAPIATTMPACASEPASEPATAAA